MLELKRSFANRDANRDGVPVAQPDRRGGRGGDTRWPDRRRGPRGREGEVPGGQDIPGVGSLVQGAAQEGRRGRLTDVEARRDRPARLAGTQ